MIFKILDDLLLPDQSFVSYFPPIVLLVSIVSNMSHILEGDIHTTGTQLLLGVLEQEGEEDILEAGVSVSCKLWTVSHHCWSVNTINKLKVIREIVANILLISRLRVPKKC